MTASVRASLHARFAAFISSYVALPAPEYADVLALWAMGTWIYAQTFDAYPYLVVSAATKRAGKTRLGVEILPRLCYNPLSSGNVTNAMLFRSIEADSDTGITLTFDESESLFNEGSELRSVLNIGYRKGQVVLRMGKDGNPEKFRVYCPKVFVLIGDVYDTLRDRSIVMELIRADYSQMRAMKVYRDATVDAERAELLAGVTCDSMSELFEGLDQDKAFYDALEFLDSRDAEIWAPIFAMAAIVCPEKLPAIKRVAADLAASKTADARKAADLKMQEAEKQQEAYGERALRDLATVLRTHHHKTIASEAAVLAMRAIDTAPWRMYRGTGLNPNLLAALLRPFGVKPEVDRMGKGRAAKTLRGYRLADIQAALKRIEVPYAEASRDKRGER